MKNDIYGACKDTAARIAGRYSRNELTAAEAWEGFSIVKDFLNESIENGIQKKNVRVENLIRLLDHNMWELEIHMDKG